MSSLAAESEYLSAVFKTVGQPTVTYVERESGALERELNGALNEKGQLCLISGPSKTGKTTLYREVLRRRAEEPLVVRCDRTMKADSVWLRALEEVNFERVESRTRTRKVGGTAEVEVGGKLGWAWLAEASSRLKGTITGARDDAEVRQRVLGSPGADILIPILTDTTYRLIIEDFHYLPDEEKVTLFEQWKRFTDSEVSVIVLGTTHRAVEIANSNKDLIGRICQINVGNWKIVDLKKVCEKGFSYLKINVPTACVTTIAREAVGLPIIVQQVCLTLLTSAGEEYIHQVVGRSDLVQSEAVSRALHEVAVKRYAQFEDYYNTLVRGPREKARRYRTYEIVLLCFQLDPIKFSLPKSEIIDRIGKLSLSEENKPPVPSLNSTLAALSKFQESRNLELLEWQSSQQTLHIIEPAFLFFVRWRTIRKGTSLSQLFEIAISNFKKMKFDFKIIQTTPPKVVPTSET
jgi:hypothetical protein